MPGLNTPKETLANSLAFLQMDLVDPDFHKHALAHSRTMQAELTKLLDEAAAAGELPRCDTRKLARAIQSLIGGALLQWAIDRDSSVTERVPLDNWARISRRVGSASAAKTLLSRSGDMCGFVFNHLVN